MKAMIDKLHKEGHRIYVLTGNRGGNPHYRKVFEKYNFAYEDECLEDVFDSVKPQVTLFFGAFDTNYDWRSTGKESVRFSAGLINLLIAFCTLKKGRFIYLSSERVYQKSYPEDIAESETVSAADFRSLALAQGEEACRRYRESFAADIVVLRLDNLYDIPISLEQISDVCGVMCLEALRTGSVTVNGKHLFSLLYVSDAVEFLYKIIACTEHKYDLYHISSGQVISEADLAGLLREKIGGDLEIRESNACAEYRIVLSNKRFDSEFGIRIFHPVKTVLEKQLSIFRKMLDRDNGQKHKNSWWRRIPLEVGSIIRFLLPFVENMICFIPFFMLNNRAVGSRYFANLDFYLLYVLLFAVIYGQGQAVFSAILAVGGYCFRQMYHRSSWEVMLDYNTYVWVAQLFLVGLAVGYLKDRISVIREEDKGEIDYLINQLKDIQDINLSNVRMKDVLETKVINQNNSIGVVYEITSSLDKYEPESVLFYAAQVLAQLVGTKDVAIYTVTNRDYARLFSFTSDLARQLGNSIRYTQMEGLYEAMQEHKVYINKELTETYPLMAHAIYDGDEMQLILMIWGIPWDRMNLSQANMLVIIGYLIQNAVVRATRYLDALENRRYLEGTEILDQEAFQVMVHAYTDAQNKGLTQCVILGVEAGKEPMITAGNNIRRLLRNTDYLGILKGRLYILLANTTKEDAGFVIDRMKNAGYPCGLREDID